MTPEELRQRLLAAAGFDDVLQALRNGDVVEILTTTGHLPSKDWLAIAKTSRARNKIKHFIHTQEKVRSIELGKRLFEKDDRRFGIEKAKVTPEELARIGEDFSQRMAALEGGVAALALSSGSAWPSLDVAGSGMSKKNASTRASIR